MPEPYRTAFRLLTTQVEGIPPMQARPSRAAGLLDLMGPMRPCLAFTRAQSVISKSASVLSGPVFRIASQVASYAAARGRGARRQPSGSRPSMRATSSLPPWPQQEAISVAAPSLVTCGAHPHGQRSPRPPRRPTAWLRADKATILRVGPPRSDAVGGSA